jgi:cell division protein FtsB
MRLVRQLWLPATLVLYGWLAISAVVGQRGLLHLWKLQQEQRALEADAVALLHENEELRNRIARLQNDDEFFEKVAREELGFAKKGEIVYRFRASSDTPEQTEHSSPTGGSSLSEQRFSAQRPVTQE